LLDVNFEDRTPNPTCQQAVSLIDHFPLIAPAPLKRDILRALSALSEALYSRRLRGLTGEDLLAFA